MPYGSLSLPARLYLLAWDTRSTEVTGATRLPHLVRAGALTELAQRGLLVDDDDIATPADMDSLTGDPVLDGLLELVRESRPHRWHTWVSLHARVTVDAVREQLTAEGYLRAEKKRVLGLFPSVEHVLAQPAVAEALQAQARQILEGPAPLTEVSDRDAISVALAAAAELRTVLPDTDRNHHLARVEALTERSEADTPALRKLLTELHATPPVTTGD